MGSFCLRCDDWIGTTDPHDCKGPVWVRDVAVPGFTKLRVSGPAPEIQALLDKLASPSGSGAQGL